MAIPVNTYTKHNWVDDSSPDLDAENLNEIETGIKDNNDAIKAIAAAVVSQIVNDPDKIASMAALHAVNQTLGTLNTTVTNINSNLNNQTITSSGLNLTWGSVNSGGYTVIGNIVIINIRIAINTSLSAGTEYLISGFPSPKGLSANSIAVSCSHHSLTAICYLGVQGLLSFNPSSAISSGTSLFFSAFYIKQ
jgi:hypothetical protein